MRGDRQLSRPMMEKIITKLNIDAHGADELRKRYIERPRKETNLKYDLLRDDQIKLMADWYHCAILALLDLPEFENKPKWIAKRLNITEAQAAGAVQRLIRLQILSLTSAGKLLENKGPQRTTTGIPNTNAYLKELQRQFLELSTLALAKVPIEKRSHSGITFSIDAALIPELKKRIDKFRRSTHKFTERSSKRKDAVYQLAISLFPLTDVQ